MKQAEITAKFRQDAFTLFKDGEISGQVALDMIARQLDRLQDDLVPLQESEKVLRNQASVVVEYLGGKAAVAGFGSFVITAPAHSVSYDGKGLDGLVAALIGEGQTELAKRITAYRKESSKAGYLRISRGKETNTNRE